jgi:hypothetical protein
LPKADPRQSIGVDASFLLGSIFVRWDATQNTELTFTNPSYDLYLNRKVPLFPTPTTIARVQFAVPNRRAASCSRQARLDYFPGANLTLIAKSNRSLGCYQYTRGQKLFP